MGLLIAAVEVGVVATTLAVGAASEALATIVAGCALAWGGLSLAVAKGGRWRPLVWEVQAVGFVVAGAAWLAALVSAGVLRR